MESRNIIWLPTVRRKLVTFRNDRFSSEETLDFITRFILETESLLANLVLTKGYTEESGEYKGISRVVIYKFKVYYEIVGNEVVILAVRFPGEP